MRFFGMATIVFLNVAGVLGTSAKGGEPFLGSWTLTLPDCRAGWLGVDRQDGQLSARLLWGAGSVVPVDKVAVADGKLVLTRVHKPRRGKAAGRAKPTLETITVERAGKTLHLTRLWAPNAAEPTRETFTGNWCPPVPPKPDLNKARFAAPIVLFDGKSLDGWTLTDPGRANGWSVRDGELINEPEQPEGKHVSYGNLRTIAEFDDFNLTLEVNVGQRQNSGVYLRGIYEVQVTDSYGQELDSHHMGAVYSRIAPTAAAEKPAGQWQTLDITLLDRHVTVVLNGKRIIDNEPVLGCTGGALWSDPFKSGPVYLQGDHTGIRYRNIVLRPIVKR